MRHPLVLLPLLILVACGGGDVTAPPKDVVFGLSVSGPGPGQGRVLATSTNGNLDCQVGAGLAPCSRTLPEHTSIRLETTAGAQSVFQTWGGDAQVCGTVSPCTLTVDRDLIVLATFANAFPAVAGAYNVSGTFDNLPSATAFFNGTVTLTQASRTDGALGGSAALVAQIGTQIFNITDDALESGNISMTGVVAFTLRGGTATWTFTGTQTGNAIVNGRHSLASPGSTASSGPWSGTRASGIRAVRRGGGSQMGALLEQLRH